MMWWCIFGLIVVSEALYNLDLVPSCPDICQCDSLLTRCQHKELLELPQGIDHTITSLDLSFNGFNHLSLNLKSYKNLRYLNMSHNRISTLDHSNFNGLEKLEILDLAFNLFHDWKDIHTAAFWPLSKLAYLDLSSNELKNIPQLARHFNVITLQSLKLNNCSMTTISTSVFNNIINLKELYLADNPVKNIAGKFRISSLKTLDLSNCLLEYIDDTVLVGLPELENLLLHNNIYLRNFSCSSDSLSYLDLSDCNLEYIPTGDMRALTYLDLKGNSLRGVASNSFSKLPNLLTLNLSLNAISSIEQNAFRRLENLQIMNLSMNKLSTVGDEIFLPTISLTYLDLSHNYIRFLGTIHSSSLKVLDLSYCEIYSTDDASLSNLPKLTKLSLKSNYLTYLPDSWTADRLVFLDLSRCRIKSINKKTFAQMPYLRTLNLTANQLTSIDPTFFPQVVYVSLGDNQWSCDCHKLKSTYDWLMKTNERVDGLICDSPETLEEKTWYEACQKEWNAEPNKKDRLWWYSIGLVISMLFLLVAVAILRKMNSIKEKRFRQAAELRRTQEREAREALQRMQRRQREYREEQSRNAPDPRESQGPPSYSDALLLPKLDSSHPSLAGSMHSLGSRPSVHGSNPEINKKNKVRRKRRRRSNSLESRRPSRATIDDSDSSQPDRSRQVLESDF